MEKLINSLVNLPDTLKKVLEETDSIVKQMPPDCTHKKEWNASIRIRTCENNGNVGTLRRKLEEKFSKLQSLLLLWDGKVS